MQNAPKRKANCSKQQARCKNMQSTKGLKTLSGD
jgi:hypothetical protein